MKVAIAIRRLSGAEDLPPPRAESGAAAGYDLRAAIPETLTLAPAERRLIPTGFALALPVGWEAQIRPRSGLALKHGVTVLNSPGTIDADYRGEIGVILINHGDAPFAIERGDRIAQLTAAPVARVDWQFVEQLPDSPRASGGFGSTGRR